MCEHTQRFPAQATGVAGARRDWTEQERPLLLACIRAYVAALVRLSSPRHLDPASALLAKRPHPETELSRQVASLFTDPCVGFLPAAALDLAAMQTVLDPRVRWAEWHSAPPIEQFYDLTWYQRAFWAED